MAMHILYHFRTQGRGAEGVHIAGIVRALERLGNTVHFSSPTGVDPRQTRGSDPFAGGGKTRTGFWAGLARHSPSVLFELLEIGYNLVSLRRNARMLRRTPCDLIYERHAFFLCATAWLAQRRGIPLLVEVNELVGDERVRKQPAFRALAERCDRFCLRRAALVTVVSPHLQRRVMALGVPPERVLVLPNAVEAEDYRVPADGSSVRRTCGIGESILVGFVGWLVAWHHLEDLVTAVADACRHRDVRLMIVGSGPLQGALETLAASRGIRDRLHVVGAVPHDEIPRHIAAMDIAVIPHSNAYRSPIKLFEYMGQGRAVLAPRTEPIATVVRDGENGLLFDPENMASFQSGLDRLLADPDLRQRLGAQARADVMARHTWDRNVQSMLAQLRPAAAHPAVP